MIEKVTNPSKWCAPMAPVKKKSGQVRITVNYKHLNQNVKHQTLMLPNLDDIGPKLAGAVRFSALDAASGYYQCCVYVFFLCGH